MPKFLSQIKWTNDFELGKINFIQAPCGSGKTTYCANKLPSQVRKFGTLNKAYIYLTPFTASKEQLFQNGQFNLATKNWYKKMENLLDIYNYNVEKDLNPAIQVEKLKPVVMTIQKFAWEVEKNASLWENIGLLVVDEADYWLKLVLQEQDKNSPNRKLGSLLFSKCNHFPVVFVSATGKEKLQTHFNPKLNLLQHEEKLFQLQQTQTTNFTNLQKELERYLKTKPKGEKFAIYTSQIRTEKKIQQFLEQKGIKTVVLFSLNSNEQMEEKDLEIRKTILQSEIDYSKLDEIDCIIFNESYQRAINIFDERFQALFVNDCNKDVIEQSRGRFRFWIKLLSIKGDKIGNKQINLENKWIEKWLLKEQKVELMKEIGEISWKKSVELLEQNGFEIKNGKPRVKGKRRNGTVIEYKT